MRMQIGPLGKIKAVNRQYALRFNLVLILTGLSLLGLRIAAQNIHPAALQQADARTDSSVAERDPRPVIVCFGDSLTAGLGIDRTESYPADLQRTLDTQGYRYRVVNEGVSGETTKDGLARVSRVLAHKPQIVVLEFGGNDGLRGLPVANTKRNLAAIVQQLQHAGVKVALAGISLPPQYGGDYITHFDAMYPAVARQFHLPLLPFLLQDVYGVEGDIQPDGVHPTAQGARQVAANIEKLLQPMLKK
jgi:acyl-CoA thioesterase-1